MAMTSNNAFSANVTLSLRMNNTVHSLRKLSPTRAVLRQPVDLPVGHADIIVTVDGTNHISAVYLPNGASSLSALVQLEPVEVCQSAV
jgi:hypothetical protein